MTAPGGFTMNALRWASRIFLIAGCFALGYSGSAIVDGLVYQSVNARQFVAPVKAVAPRTSALARIDIPRLGMSVVVAEGTSTRALTLGAGHIPGTALPGERGNIGIAGHRDTFFRGLRNVHAGDTITLTTREGALRYAVQWTKVVSPSNVAVLRNSSEPVLTLVTCYPFYFIGEAPKRFIVRARRITPASREFDP